jgi:phenylacetate-coenzyme A ligase PaaK-like adenylate-forming protein
MRELGITPDEIQTTADLAKLPVTTKDDFLADPQSFVLDSAGLPRDEQTIWDVIYTTGTTSGVPAPVYTTTADYLRFLRTATEQSALIDLRRGDRLISLFPLTRYPTGASVRTSAEAAACGASVIAAMPGRQSADGSSIPRSLDDVIALAAEHDATAIVGIAGFVRHFLMRANELGTRLPSLRVCRLSGESSSSAFRSDVAERMSAVGASDRVIVNRYGSTEQGTALVECHPEGGFHDVAPDQVFLEVVDDADESLPDGDAGRLVFSHLVRRGTVFLRYAMGDVGILDHAPCPECGRGGARLVGNPTRKSDIVKIKGTLVNLRAVQDALDAVPFIDDYQLIIDKADDDPLGPDEMTVFVATRAVQDDITAARVVHSVRERSNITPQVRFVNRDAIFDPQTMVKSRRIVDARDAE